MTLMIRKNEEGRRHRTKAKTQTKTATPTTTAQVCPTTLATRGAGFWQTQIFKVLKEVRSGTGERWRARATCLRRGSSGDPQCSGILGDTPAPCHPPSCIAPHRAFCTQASRVRSGRSCALAKSAPRKRGFRALFFFFEKIRIPRLFIRREQHCRMFTSCYS